MPLPSAKGDAIWARWHRQLTGWQPPVQMSAAGTVSVFSSNYHVAVDATGEALIAWSQYNATTRRYEGTMTTYWPRAPRAMKASAGMPCAMR